jgi:hypothetical protein
LQAQLKNIKKLSKHQIYQSGRNFFQKNYPKEFAGSTKNPKRNIETPNLPIRTKIFQKKVFLIP